MLEVADLGKRFGPRWIFRHVSFDLGPGDALAILGRNGAGKSTFLRVIASLLSPTEGAVRLPVGDPRLILGFSALEMALYPQLTVTEHLRLAGDLRGVPSRAQELLEVVRLAYAASVPCSELSTGMKARLRLALAIQSRPSVLLLDEPGAGLDPEGRETLEQVVTAQLEHGCVLLATNDPSEWRLARHAIELGD